MTRDGEDGGGQTASRQSWEVTRVRHMGTRLRELRRKAQLTQDQLAIAVGLTRARITQWEGSSFYNTDLERLLKLLHVLKLNSIEELLGDSPSLTTARTMYGSREEEEQAELRDTCQRA